MSNTFGTGELDNEEEKNGFSDDGHFIEKGNIYLPKEHMSGSKGIEVICYGASSSNANAKPPKKIIINTHTHTYI